MSKYRLNKGGEINRQKEVNITFNEKKIKGFEKDTIASALIANGIHFVGRSFKYHRPRGIISAGFEEPNAIVQLELGNRTEPNVRATETLIYEGLIAKSQNHWPSLKYDFGEINDILAPIFPAGFYYKTFMWPPNFWEKYEYFIRKAAGLGKSPLKDDPDNYEHIHYHCDVLIIGGGLSGLFAAKLTAKSGLKVLLVDNQETLGGSLLAEKSDTFTIDDQLSHDWLHKIINNISNYTNLKIINSTTLFAYMHNNYLLAIQNIKPLIHPNQKPNNLRQIIWKIRAKKVILAERPLTFHNNDRPGIMLANSSKKYLNYYGVIPGNETIIFTNNDDAYKTAIDFHNEGISVKAIVDVRKETSGDLPKKALSLGIKVYLSHVITNTFGRFRISSVIINKIDSSGKNIIGKPLQLNCDLLCVSGGWTPTVHLFSQSRGKLTYREEDAAYIPGQSFQEEVSVGSCNGNFSFDSTLKETFNKSIKIIRELNGSVYANKIPLIKSYTKDLQQNIWIVPSNINFGKTNMFVDLQNDVKAKDIRLALKEGYNSIEHIKRYTTTGMATDQGKMGNINALGVISEITNKPLSQLGTTTYRLPFIPVSFGAIAGRHIKEFFDIKRNTPIHDWHVKNGAIFEDVGQWKRPWYYPKEKETMEQAVSREVKATRDSLSILDASTLGKIDIKGKDASELLNRVYTNKWSKLAIGKCRYGVMLGDDGMVIDDGVTTRLAKNHYLMTTTTGNAASVLAKLEDWIQTEWPELRVFLTSITEQFSTISLNGPNSKKVLKKICPSLDLSIENFPHMSYQNAEIEGHIIRIMRISFSGEICFEINVPSSYGQFIWELCMKEGEEFNITPYGTEAMHVLRAEKGFFIVGQETDGTVTPVDLDLNWIISKDKYDFIGKRSLYRSDTIKEDRKQLVGILPKNPNESLEEGAQLVEKITELPMRIVGHVSSSYYSPNLERNFALALVKGGSNKIGKILYAPMLNKTVEVTITNPVFIDPKGEKINN